MSEKTELRVINHAVAPRTSGGNPFGDSSQDCLTILLQMALDQGDIIHLMSQHANQEADSSFDSSSDYRQLARLAQVDEKTACLIDDQCQRKLGGKQMNMSACSMYELACAWGRLKDSTDGKSIATLLWLVARSRLKCFRKLEAAMVEELRHRAIKLMVQPPIENHSAVPKTSIIA